MAARERAGVERPGSLHTDAAEAQRIAACNRVSTCRRLLTEQLPSAKAQELLDVADAMVQAPCQKRLRELATELRVNRDNGEGDVALHDKIRRAWVESVDIALRNQVASVAPQPVMKVRKTKAKAAASASSNGALSAQSVTDMLDDEGRQRAEQTALIMVPAKYG